MEAVVAAANVRRAWAQVKSNRGAPGCDGMNPAGQRVNASLTAYLGRRLKLPVNERKSRVAPVD